MRRGAKGRVGLASIFCWVLGCASAPQIDPSPLVVHGLVFENRSQTPLTRIQLLVPATGAFVSCGHISPGNPCASTFPEVVWQGNALEVTWSQAGNEWSSGPITLSPNSVVRGAGNALVRVVVIAPGSVGVELEPVEAP